MKSFTGISDSLYTLFISDGVSRLIYLFPKVFSLAEKLLGKTVKCCFFGGVKKKFWSSETYVSACCVLHVYIFHFILSFFDLRR